MDQFEFLFDEEKKPDCSGGSGCCRGNVPNCLFPFSGYDGRNKDGELRGRYAQLAALLAQPQFDIGQPFFHFFLLQYLRGIRLTSLLCRPTGFQSKKLLPAVARSLDGLFLLVGEDLDIHAEALAVHVSNGRLHAVGFGGHYFSRYKCQPPPSKKQQQTTIKQSMLKMTLPAFFVISSIAFPYIHSGLRPIQYIIDRCVYI